MVYIVDEGSVYDAPLDRVWKLGEAHATNIKEIHPSFLNYRSEKVGENAQLNTWETEVEGRRIKTRSRFTAYPPLGTAIEMLEGPMAGSKFFNYYVPKGVRTQVNVVGEFMSPMMSDDQLRPAVLSFLDQAFKEDSTYLKRMR